MDFSSKYFILISVKSAHLVHRNILQVHRLSNIKQFLVWAGLVWFISSRSVSVSTNSPLMTQLIHRALVKSFKFPWRESVLSFFFFVVVCFVSLGISVVVLWLISYFLHYLITTYLSFLHIPRFLRYTLLCVCVGGGEGGSPIYLIISRFLSFQCSSVQFSPLTDWVVGGTMTDDSLILSCLFFSYWFIPVFFVLWLHSIIPLHVYTLVFFIFLILHCFLYSLIISILPNPLIIPLFHSLIIYTLIHHSRARQMVDCSGIGWKTFR